MNTGCVYRLRRTADNFRGTPFINSPGAALRGPLRGIPTSVPGRSAKDKETPKEVQRDVVRATIRRHTHQHAWNMVSAGRQSCTRWLRVARRKTDYSGRRLHAGKRVATLRRRTKGVIRYLHLSRAHICRGTRGTYRCARYRCRPTHAPFTKEKARRTRPRRVVHVPCTCHLYLCVSVCRQRRQNPNGTMAHQSCMALAGANRVIGISLVRYTG